MAAIYKSKLVVTGVKEEHMGLQVDLAHVVKTGDGIVSGKSAYSAWCKSWQDWMRVGTVVELTLNTLTPEEYRAWRGAGDDEEA